MELNPPPIQHPITDKLTNSIWVRWFDAIYLKLRNTFDNTVVVKKASDLINIDSTKNYMIDGAIDMGTQSIIIPEGGISISGLNGARDTSILYSSADNYTMFTSPVGGYSGNVVLESCTIDVTGANSKVFDLDDNNNSSAMDVTGVNFGRSPAARLTSLGKMRSYRQLLLNGVGFLFINDGLEFEGTWTGLAVTTTIIIGFPANATLFKEGASFTINNMRSDINFLSVQPSSVLCDFREANITSKGGVALTNVRTTADDALPNLPSSSVYSRFRNCLGIRNTYVGSKWYLTTESTTTINAVNTPVKIAGTTSQTIAEWFDNPANNQTRYIGGQTIAYEAQCRFSFSGNNSDQIKLSMWQYVDATSSFVQVGRDSPPVTMNAAGRAENIAYDIVGDISENDYLEVRVKNISGARNVTLLTDSSFFVEERSS